mgnify:FL=1
MKRPTASPLICQYLSNGYSDNPTEKRIQIVLFSNEVIGIMAETVCGNCDKMLDTEDFDVEPCQDCGKWHFCEKCAEDLKKFPPHLILCQSCEIDYEDAMTEYDDDF